MEKLQVSVDLDNQLSKYGSKLFAKVLIAEACTNPEGGGGGGGGQGVQTPPEISQKFRVS